MASAETRTHRRNDRGYLPGRLYDLAFGGVLRGVRRSGAAAVTRDEGVRAFCHKRGEIRHFRLDRMLEVKPAKRKNRGLHSVNPKAHP